MDTKISHARHIFALLETEEVTEKVKVDNVNYEKGYGVSNWPKIKTQLKENCTKIEINLLQFWETCFIF